VCVNKKFDGHEDLAKDRWYMAFPRIVTLDYVTWAGYSFKKCYCDAAVYMIISFIVGQDDAHGDPGWLFQIPLFD
jgi:hypothetical protein